MSMRIFSFYKLVTIDVSVEEMGLKTWCQLVNTSSAFYQLVTIVVSIEKMGLKDCEMFCQPWTTRMPKAAQPNLNYIGKTTSRSSAQIS